MKKSSFRMGWILVMFDLPVVSDEDRRSATRFRNALLENGYMMIQFSVYARPCVSAEQVDKHAARVQSFTPAAGNVRILFLTDAQWGSGISLTGRNYDQGNRAVNASMPQQIEFWE